MGGFPSAEARARADNAARARADDAAKVRADDAAIAQGKAEPAQREAQPKKQATDWHPGYRPSGPPVSFERGGGRPSNPPAESSGREPAAKD